MSQRSRWYQSRALALVIGVATLLAIALPVLANLTGSAFEGNDGNLVATTGNTDWNNVVGRVRGDDLASGTSDNSFGQGTKEDDANVTVVTGSIPQQQSDLTRFYVASEFANSSNFLYLAWERTNVLGSANMDFEINKLAQPNLTTTGAKTLNRSPGDMLVTFDFTNGGGTPVLGLLRWITAANGVAADCFSANARPCWGAPPAEDVLDGVNDNRLNLSSAGFAEGAVNAATVTDPIANVSLPGLTFGEAAINLTAAGVFPSGTCTAFGSAFLKSRSSASFPAEVKDFVAPKPVTISNCGKIVINKVTNPSPDTSDTSFSFTAGGGLTPTSFSLKNGGSQTYESVVVGSGYTVAETVPTGWDLISAVCDDGSPVSNISVSPNETVTCTFTNRARGTIIVEKQTDPNGATGSFTFTGDAAGSIGDGGQITVSNLAPGTYTSTEASPSPSFDLKSIVCNDSDSSGSVATATATFNLQAGETVKCTFTNTQRGRINIHKQDDAGNALEGAIFTLFTDNAPLGGSAPHGAEDTSTGLTCTTNANGNCSFTNVVPGQYWLVETKTPDGYDTAADQNVIVGAGETKALTFTDVRKFKVIVLVCQESNNQLYPSTVTVDGVDKTSLGHNGGGTLTDADLCALGGASYGGKHTGNHPANVNIP
jgi:hypothetical protein